MKAEDLISKFKNWVVIGDVGNSKKYASMILNKFKEKGYNVAGVHKASEGAYKKLSDVPFEIEAIDLCINARDGIKYLMEGKELGIKYVLVQPGAESKEIMDFCDKNGITIIQGCALVELRKI
ncbi:MAG: CoA-binding protein [Sarcina sp.]